MESGEIGYRKGKLRHHICDVDLFKSFLLAACSPFLSRGSLRLVEEPREPCRRFDQDYFLNHRSKNKRSASLEPKRGMAEDNDDKKRKKDSNK